MNKIANRQAACDALLEAAENDRNVIVLCSDSRGSGSMTSFAETFPAQFIETGIAEQNLVSIASGLAKCGKRSFAVSPASFLSTRSYEQIKVDVAYSHMNVKLVGISGGVSYGALGMTHHSLQDIAAISAVPGMRVYLPSDRFQTKWLFRKLCKDDEPAYIRLGRNPVEDIYNEETSFVKDKAKVLKSGSDVLIVACGELVRPAADAATKLEKEGVSVGVLDMYCIKPMDTDTLLNSAESAKLIVTVEEHCPFGGMGSMVSQYAAANMVDKRVVNLTLPDEPVVTGTSKEVFRYYGLDSDGIYCRIKELI